MAVLATSCGPAVEKRGEPVRAATIIAGDLSAEFRDNSGSPDVLSGMGHLFHTKAAADFDAIDTHTTRSLAGLNFEHIISGHSDPANWFAPRKGPCTLYRGKGKDSVVLVRKVQDDPWAIESTMTYTVTAPHYIDFEFRCRARDVERFGKRGYAALLWANYINDVEDMAMHFIGVTEPGGKDGWISADPPPTHPDYIAGGTYRSLAAPALEYDADHNAKLNLWSYDYPRITKPFYYGRAARGMTVILMFDKLYSPEDEIRFSLFRAIGADRALRPAWDFQYVIHPVEAGKEYGYRGRFVWKSFVSPEDCLREYETWAKGHGDR